jgi:hypothetical protein
MPATKHRRKNRLNKERVVPVKTPVILANQNEAAVVKTRINAGRLAVNHSEVVR